MLKGNLSAFGLGQVLQSLAINHHTGTLSITSPSGGQKFIYFVSGNISLFSHGKSETPRIGEVLVRLGKLSKSDLEAALESQRQSKQMLGKVLLESNLVTREDINEAIKTKIREEIFELFLLEDGEFEFQQDYFPEHLFDALQRAIRVTVNTNAVIMEALRRLDEWGIINSQIKTLDEIFIRTGKEDYESKGYEEEVLALVDGRTPVAAICSTLLMTRFECCTALYNLSEEGVVRTLTPAEAVEAIAAARRSGDAEKTISFLRFTTQLFPDEPKFFLELSAALNKASFDREAQKASLDALTIYFNQGRLEDAAKIAESLPPNGDFQLRELKILLKTFVELKLLKKAVWAGKQLAQLYTENNEPAKAFQVLESLIVLGESDLNLKIQVATLLEKSGDIEHATKYFEEVAATLERQKKIKDQIKILKVIADLDPNRADLKQKISMLEALQEKLELGRKRRVTFAGVGLIVLFTLVIIPLVYLLKANELFAHAQRMEAIAMNTGDFAPARQVFEEFVMKFSLSNKAHDAKLALERLATIERGRIRTIEAEAETAKSRKQQELIDEMSSLTTKVAELSAQAAEAEKSRDFKSAHHLLGEALRISTKLQSASPITLPLELRSNPSGATVRMDGDVVGQTPVVVRYVPGNQRVLKLSRKGCIDREDVVTLATQHELSMKLERQATKQFLLSSTFDQPIVACGGLIVFLSREGVVHGFSPERNEVVWQTACGHYGDRVSNLCVAADLVYLGQVENGLLVVDCSTGGSRSIVPELRGPVLAAPVVSSDLKWIAVSTLRGEVVLIDREKETIEGRFTTENEIVTRPAFAGDLLVAGSTDGYIYTYSVSGRSLRSLREVGSPISAGPVEFDGNLLFGTEDGAVHRFDPLQQVVARAAESGNSPVRELVVAPSRVFVGLETGEVHVIEPGKSSVPMLKPRTGEALGGLTFWENVLYSSLVSGRLTAYDASLGTELWSWRAESATHTRPLVLAGTLYVAGASGSLQLLEVVE